MSNTRQSTCSPRRRLVRTSISAWLCLLPSDTLYEYHNRYPDLKLGNFGAESVSWRLLLLVRDALLARGSQVVTSLGNSEAFSNPTLFRPRDLSTPEGLENQTGILPRAWSRSGCQSWGAWTEAQYLSFALVRLDHLPNALQRSRHARSALKTRYVL